jgi:hypothetical protein
MKKITLLAFLMLLPFIGMAQQNAQQKDSPILTPTVVVGDLVFVVQVLKTVEIKGAEVDAYLQVQQTFDKLIQDLNAQQKKVNDTVDIKIALNIAQATVTFMDRATLQGQNASIYKRFVDALVASTKAK